MINLGNYSVSTATATRRRIMMKIGIIRCQQTEDLCPGTTDFKVTKDGPEIKILDYTH